MTAAITTPETRRCVRCWETKPLDREHFGGRFSRGHSDFNHHCLACGQKAKNKRAFPIQDGRDWS